MNEAAGVFTSEAIEAFRFLEGRGFSLIARESEWVRFERGSIAVTVFYDYRGGEVDLEVSYDNECYSMSELASELDASGTPYRSWAATTARSMRTGFRLLADRLAAHGDTALSGGDDLIVRLRQQRTRLAGERERTNSPRTARVRRPAPLRLADRWSSILLDQPETGMGYQVVRLTLRDGRQFDGVTVIDGVVTGLPHIVAAGLTSDDVAEIVVTHTRNVPAVLRARRAIETPADLKELLSQLQPEVAAGTLTQSTMTLPIHGVCIVGELPTAGPWPDVIDAEFRDRAGRRYRLFVETFHGAGGEWTPLDADD
jgi:hypothetical protein